MSSDKCEAISVRTTRLNKLLLGDGGSGNEGVVSKQLADALNRESLLDALSVLYTECQKESQKKSTDKHVNEFVSKYRPIMEETNTMRVNINDFAVKDLIGKGYFGEVHLVKEKRTQDIYAMKRIRKSGITTSQVREERDIMAMHKSDWITSLQFAFQDPDYLYLVMEYLPGGDLLSLMIRNGAFDESLAKFYLAELTQALHTLHNMGYVHRDIKPENILLDRCGHLKLADFGNAAMLNKDGSVISLSPVGTPDYIAPELLQTLSTIKITKSVHDVTCDFWSMGIIGYELVTEETPFHEENVHETFSKILYHCETNNIKAKLEYPDKINVSDQFKDLIDHLVTNVDQRLSYKKIIEHPFFRGVNWNGLRDQLPPIIPNVASEDDVSNFEDIDRKRGRSTFLKKTLPLARNPHFSGENLPFLGYSYVYSPDTVTMIDPTLDNQLIKLHAKIKEQEKTLLAKNIEIKTLQREAMAKEKKVAEMSSSDKIMRDVRIELSSLKETLKERVKELAASKTEIKTLRSSLKVEEEQRLKNDNSIAEVLQSTYQKWEKAKKLSDQNYEKQVAEKRMEVQQLNEKLLSVEGELKTQLNECGHLGETMRNYKEMLKQSKDQLTKDREDFDKSKQELIDGYEQKIADLKQKLKGERDQRVKDGEEQRHLRNELRDSIHTRDSISGVKRSLDKTMLEMRSRINQQFEENRLLRESKVAADKALNELQNKFDELSVQLATHMEETAKVQQQHNDQKRTSSGSEDDPQQYGSAQGSWSDLNAALLQEQLRNDLVNAQENESKQRKRADELETMKERLEDAISKLEGNSVGGLLERQNSKLEDQLVKAREEVIVERQASRAAHLAVYKLEKQIDELTTEKKVAARRAELMEQKLSKIREEKQELDGKIKISGEQIANRDQEIKKLQREIDQLKGAVRKENANWKRAEEERMGDKREIIEHIARVQKLEEIIEEGKRRLAILEQKNESLLFENKRLINERDLEQSEAVHASDSLQGMQVKYDNLSHNYNMLKEACKITDVQMTEMEELLDREMKRNEQAKLELDEQLVKLKAKEDELRQIKHSLSAEIAEKQMLENKYQQVQADLIHTRDQLDKVATDMATQQATLIDKTSVLFNVQENLEVMTMEVDTLQRTNENYLKEMEIVKEENSKILTEYFTIKEDRQKLDHELNEVQFECQEMRQEIEHLNQLLAEQKNYYVQRDIKAEATLAQHKKLIDYLQQKVEELSNKKKKSLVEKIFGSHDNTDSAGHPKKENIPPGSSSTAAVKDTLPYRRMQEDLRRERCRNSQLKEKLLRTKSELIKNQEQQPASAPPVEGVSQNIITSDDGGSVVETPRREEERFVRNEIGWSFKSKSAKMMMPSGEEVESVMKEEAAVSSTASGSGRGEGHRFEFTLETPSSATASGAGSLYCLACKKVVLTSNTFMRCKECRATIHRKCRNAVSGLCDGGESGTTSSLLTTTGPSLEDIDTVDMRSGNVIVTEATIEAGSRSEYAGDFLFRPTELSPPVLVNCVYSINADCILVGAATGLYSYHYNSPRQLVHIQGLACINSIEINRALNKAILIADNQENLYQCDVRHLLVRSQMSAVQSKPKLEAHVLDLPFANRSSNERWHLVKISANKVGDTMAIAATSSRIVILKYDVDRQLFKPVRALDTATPVSNILFTQHSAIVSSDKFFEIDMVRYSAEEFVSDATAVQLKRCRPMATFKIGKSEFLLCFEEFGIYVDEFGCPSRQQEINWTYTPTGFMYLQGILFISHFNMVQVMRIYRSSAHEISVQYEDNERLLEADDSTAIENVKAFIPMSRPQLLDQAGKLSVFCLVTRSETDKQEVLVIDGMKSLRAIMSASVETLASESDYPSTRSSSESTLSSVPQ